MKKSRANQRRDPWTDLAPLVIPSSKYRVIECPLSEAIRNLALGGSDAVFACFLTNKGRGLLAPSALLRFRRLGARGSSA